MTGSPPDDLLASAHDVLPEHRVIMALAHTDVPAAPVIRPCDDVDVTGAPFYVMAFVDGPVLHDRAAAERLPVAARQRAAESRIDVLVALREVHCWLAFHAWRSGCIAAGVYTRYKAGQMGAAADDLARFEDSVEHSMQLEPASAGIA